MLSSTINADYMSRQLTFRRTSAIKNQMTNFLRNKVLKKLGT